LIDVESGAQLWADPKDNASVLANAGIAFDHSALQLDRAANRVNDAWEFHQQPVASRLDDATAMFLYLRVDELAAMRFETIERAFLVVAH
jgi:hypothetical protein